MSHDTLFLRAAVVVAAVAVVAFPHWRRVAAFVAEAAKASGPYRGDIARGVAAAALVALAFGVVRVPSLAGLRSMEFGDILDAVRTVTGVGLLVNAGVLFSKAAETVRVRARRSAKDVLVGLILVAGTPWVPDFQVSLPIAPGSPAVTAVVYVYEKDEAAVPVGVTAGINKLNREKKVMASLFEKDTTDGEGQTPDQYKPALDAATKESIPSLVVLSGSSVVRVIKSPKTEIEVLGVVP